MARKTRNIRKITQLFGREVIYSSATEITKNNVVDILNKAIYIHNRNVREIDYLENYYCGDQPVLYRKKKNRPDINNKIVINKALDAVDFNVALNYGEPIKYVNANVNNDKSDAIVKLNKFMDSEDKSQWDIELGEWQNIAGTAYRYILPDKTADIFMDEAPFSLDVIDPRKALVVYSAAIGKRPLMGVNIRVMDDNSIIYDCWSNNHYFEVKDGKVISDEPHILGDVPIIEYPKNARRMGVVEITMTITDAINESESNRVDGIQQFVQAFMKFVNCEISKDEFIDLCDLGAIMINSTEGRQADVDLVTSELSQTGVQTCVGDLDDKYREIQAMPNRQENSGGDTGSAVYMRNGWDFAYKRADKNTPIIIKSERRFLKIALGILNTNDTKMKLEASDIEVKITRNKTDNMYTKAQTLQLLVEMGVDSQIALEIVELFADPEKVYAKSKDNIELKFMSGISSSLPTDTAATDNPEDPTASTDTNNSDDVTDPSNVDDKTKSNQATVPSGGSQDDIVTLARSIKNSIDRAVQT